MNNNSGINDQKIDKLILDIYEINEKVRKTLDQISETMEKTKTSWKSSEANQLRNTYDNFKTNYNIIVKNINSYAEDFTKLKNSYKRNDIEMGKKIKLYMIDLDKTFEVNKYNEHQ